ncbi:MAG: zinc metallopeptidase [Lachnospiraceae bacterium]|nr:zinc metallopeptidase [Lachnospiraceae bacterium]MDY5742631.1 zinc metallopeptidase [Lachnospiraceae bacterium]
MPYRYGFFGDPTLILVLIGLGLTLLASLRVKSVFATYSRVRNMAGLTGAEAAARALRQAGIYDVRIERVAGSMTDHYDPRNKVLRLSETVYDTPSIAAVGVAVHECGHAVQHQVGYGPLALRSVFVPTAQIGSTLGWPIFLIGLISSISILMTIGIILFAAAVVFQLITLPVEFNASSRALRLIEETGMLSKDENRGARKVLSAAAMTYVAALSASVLNLLRLIILAGGRDRD